MSKPAIGAGVMEGETEERHGFQTGWVREGNSEEVGLELGLKGWVEVGKVERGKGVGGGENGQGQRCGAMRSRARTEVRQGESGCHMHRGAWRNKPENEPLLKLCIQALG